MFEAFIPPTATASDNVIVSPTIKPCLICVISIVDDPSLVRKGFVTVSLVDNSFIILPVAEVELATAVISISLPPYLRVTR